MKEHDLLITSPSGDDTLRMMDYDSASIVISGTHNALSQFINRTYRNDDVAPS